MYKGTRFRLRPISEIKEDLKMAHDYYGDYVRSIFFPDGNTIIMKTEDLVQIFEYSRELFPFLERITVYGAARFVNKKSLAELERLHQSGLNRIHMGMETGDDVTLAATKKGTTSEEIISAGTKVRQAGIQLSEYYLVGIGGIERTREHALESARVLSAIKPEFIRIRTFVPVPNTPLFEDYNAGKFKLLSPHQALQEIRLLIENLDAEGSTIVSDHVSNYWNVTGLMNQDREKMLAHIDQAFKIEESRFRTSDSYLL
jgi:radical SAM superfamily enzyme YgiQ (UPF0313 family)